MTLAPVHRGRPGTTLPTAVAPCGAQAYLCTAVELPEQALKLVGVEPLAKQEIAHHMLLFGAHAVTSCRGSCSKVL